MREYSTREVADLAGLPEGRVRRWARAGLVTPGKDGQGRWRYSFQDLAVLRTAGKLLDARVTVNRVTRTLNLLREQLPAGRPLSAVTIHVTGQRVVVKDRLASWEPESGQGTLDFDLQAMSKQVAPQLPVRSRSAPERQEESVDDLYQAALDLELLGRGNEARETYEAVLRRDPKLVGARINLGRLLHAAGRLGEAEALYSSAVEQSPGNAVAAFNLGVVLEDQGKTDAAADAYRAALAVDDRYADAHYNLSRLLEAQGDARGAIRHLSRFRRLMRND
ncbi:MAG: tetratricopeptide repeat protein [Woeseiaceae bacterium]